MSRRIAGASALALLLASGAAAQGPAVPGAPEGGNDYDTCMALVETDPARAESEAAHWAAFGGGAAARHCQAMAFAALGATSRAADALIGLGTEATDLPDRTRGEILLQAAALYLELEQTEIAFEATERAMRLDPGAEALTMRARLHAAGRRWGAALGDLDAAIAEGGPTPDRVMLRASGRRHEGRLAEARADAEWALELEPDLPVAWLELGQIAAAEGNRDRAREAFLKAMELDPEGDVAADARRALQLMEAEG